MNMDQKSEKFYIAEAQAFVEAHPDYIPCSENQDALFEHLRVKNQSCNRFNLAAAYDELKAKGELKLRNVVM
jgi:hypothetical protein